MIQIQENSKKDTRLRGRELINRLDLKTLPKILLHEHLDGGMRPQTVIDLASETGYKAIPTNDPGELADWFHRGAQKGSLPEYLEGFAHTTAVMQTREALERVAFEFIEDMYEDGVVYAEARFAPVFHTEGGLSQREVVEATLQGLKRGGDKYGVGWGLIICAMRNRLDSLEAAELAIEFQNQGVAGFDLAGEEAGYPPKDHVRAFQAIRRANFYITIHAGEAWGKDSIWQALQYCVAHRLGHATKLVEDMTIQDGKVVAMGTLAQYVLNSRLPLEICLKSNVDTGAVNSLEEHPFQYYFQVGMRVSLNTDDRLMSDTSMTNEYKLAVETFDLGIADLQKIALNSVKSSFLDYDKRSKLIDEIILPGYGRARAELD